MIFSARETRLTLVEIARKWPKIEGCREEKYFREDLEHGKSRVWNYNSDLLELEANYKNGIRDGLYGLYLDDGTRVVEGIYDNGKEQGWWQDWDDEHNIVVNILYEKGEVIKEIRLK